MPWKVRHTSCKPTAVKACCALATPRRRPRFGSGQAVQKIRHFGAKAPAHLARRDLPAASSSGCGLAFPSCRAAAALPGKRPPALRKSASDTSTFMSRRKGLVAARLHGRTWRLLVQEAPTRAQHAWRGARGLVITQGAQGPAQRLGVWGRRRRNRLSNRTRVQSEGMRKSGVVGMCTVMAREPPGPTVGKEAFGRCGIQTSRGRPLPRVERVTKAASRLPSGRRSSRSRGQNGASICNILSAQRVFARNLGCEWWSLAGRPTISVQWSL